MSVLSVVLGGLALLSLILATWQLWVACRFPLHRRAAPPRDCPGVTVLKPIKGCDGQTEACLRSWFAQEYDGPIQLLFGVASMEDSAVPLIRRLIEAHPDRDAALVCCERELGVNAKVSSLIQLQERSAHGFICVSDADVWAPPDFLSQAMSWLADSRIGLVNSFYEIRRPKGFGMRWEALAINADFWSQVLQSASLKPIDFALGAALVFRHSAFHSSGGFQSVADHLADDYHLGRRIAGYGLKVCLLPIVVECRSDPSSFRSAWLHQLRWARTIRACEARPYFFSVLANATLWPLVWWAAAPAAGTAAAAAGLLAVRSLQAAILERRLTRRWNLTAVWMAWIKDGLQLVVWALAFLGTSVSWRGVWYRVDKRGKLTRISVSR